MLSCNGIVLNYTFVMYNKSISKINIVENIAKELPVPPVMSYFLCDCWYTSEKIINTFAAKGFHTIGALKTNRMLYPCLLYTAWRMLYSIYVTMRYNRNYVNRDNMNGVETLLGLCSNTDIRK